MKRYSLVILLSICVFKCLAMTRSELEDFSNFLEMTSQLDLNVKSKGPDEEYDEDEPVSDNAWEESGKFEGDLILNERQRRLLVADIAEGLSRNGLQDSTKRWPNNEVIYYIQREHFSSGQVSAIQDGIDDLARASCVKFTPYKKGDQDAVVIQGSRRGCFSQVGYQGGYQVLNLSGRHPVGRGCFRHGTVVHELLHALGFYHMQSSPDRDDYIDVLWQNIVRPARHNFRKYNSFAVSDFGVGYDYESVLHYSKKAFSSNGENTLVPKQLGAEIGQRVGLSQKDIQKLNKMYCDDDSNDSNNSDDDSTQKKPNSTKKNTKNKPFTGHGIGYHQGKTVAIKLKPTVELYRLPTLPKFHIFDHFSKAPQALSPTFNERGESGKEMIFISDISSSIGEYHEPSTTKSLTLSMLDDKEEDNNNIRITTLPDEGKTDIKFVNDEENNKNPLTVYLKDLYEISEEKEDEKEDETDEYKKTSDVISHNHPTHTYLNKDYNSERTYEKEPKIINTDKLLSSSKSQTEGLGYDSKERSQSETFPWELQSYYSKKHYENNEENQYYAPSTRPKHLSSEEDRFGTIYPLRKYHYHHDEPNMSEFELSSKYLSVQS